MVYCALTRQNSTIAMLEVPARSLLVVSDFGTVVAFVEILQHGGEDFRLFVREIDSFARRFEELRPAALGEVGRLAQNVFVSSE